jgi:hypothetical protein
MMQRTQAATVLCGMAIHLFMYRADLLRTPHLTCFVTEVRDIRVTGLFRTSYRMPDKRNCLQLIFAF